MASDALGGGMPGRAAVGRIARGRALALLACLAFGLPLAARAEDPAPARDAVTKPVGLDALLKLPDQTAAPAPQPEAGGVSRKQWGERFDGARTDLRAAETRLAAAQAELEKLASGSESWQVAAPGGAGANSETGPLSYGLRQEIRRSREEVERAQKALSELRVEANLAGVPAEWIGEETAAPQPATNP